MSSPLLAWLYPTALLPGSRVQTRLSTEIVRDSTDGYTILNFSSREEEGSGKQLFTAHGNNG
jgi:hypothetical protein